MGDNTDQTIPTDATSGGASKVTESEGMTTVIEDITVTDDTDIEAAKGKTGDEIEEETGAEEEEIPKVPQVDPYYVVLSVILGGVLLGILLYFAVANIIEEPEQLDLTMYAQFYNVSYEDPITTILPDMGTTQNYTNTTSLSNVTDSWDTTITP